MMGVVAGIVGQRGRKRDVRWRSERPKRDYNPNGLEREVEVATVT